MSASARAITLNPFPCFPFDQEMPTPGRRHSSSPVKRRPDATRRRRMPPEIGRMSPTPPSSPTPPRLPSTRRRQLWNPPPRSKTPTRSSSASSTSNIIRSSAPCSRPEASHLLSADAQSPLLRSRDATHRNHFQSRPCRHAGTQTPWSTPETTSASQPDASLQRLLAATCHCHPLLQ